MIRFLFRAIGLALVAFMAFIGVSVFVAARRRGAAPPLPAPDADEIELVATFDQLDFVSHAQAFRGGRVTTWFGGGRLDLSDATLAPEGATLDISALFGGGQLIVPDDWDVESDVVGIGGVGDGRPPSEREADAPRLELRGTAIFGGWGISSARPRGASASPRP